MKVNFAEDGRLRCGGGQRCGGGLAVLDVVSRTLVSSSISGASREQRSPSRVRAVSSEPEPAMASCGAVRAVSAPSTMCS
ncbi:hypothetical protein Dimus_017315 [Dionaea muscipula]